MMGITKQVFDRYHKHTEYLDVQIVNHKVDKGWNIDRICNFLIKNINNEDGYDWTYEEAFELKEMLMASNNYRL